MYQSRIMVWGMELGTGADGAEGAEGAKAKADALNDKRAAKIAARLPFPSAPSAPL